VKNIDLIKSNSGFTLDFTINLGLLIYSDTASETILINFGDSSQTYKTLTACMYIYLKNRNT
jgi:hypothetical protein